MAVSASELIQCLAYPELEMEKIFEMDFKEGWYRVAWQEPGKFKYREMIAVAKASDFPGDILFL